jgi:hypothetical protein
MRSCLCTRPGRSGHIPVNYRTHSYAGRCTGASAGYPWPDYRWSYLLVVHSEGTRPYRWTFGLGIGMNVYFILAFREWLLDRGRDGSGNLLLS